MPYTIHKGTGFLASTMKVPCPSNHSSKSTLPCPGGACRPGCGKGARISNLFKR